MGLLLGLSLLSALSAAPLASSDPAAGDPDASAQTPDMSADSLDQHAQTDGPDIATPALQAAPIRVAPVLEPVVKILPPIARPRIAPPIHPQVTLAPAPEGAIHPNAAGAAGVDGRTVGQLVDVAPGGAARLEDHERAAGAAAGGPGLAPFKLLGESVAPGTFAQLVWNGTENFTSTSIPAAVLVVHGSSSGPVICLTAAVHGDELNGIETVRRIMHDLDPTRVSGTVIGVPIVNIQGFNRGSRYLPDRRDLNRFFPGNQNGSSASRIAHSLFYNIVVHCNALVDLHTGSFQRTNLPQVRADLNDPGAVALTRGFGATVILHSDGQGGTLRAAATRVGIPAVTLEAGGPMQVQEDAVSQSEQGVRMLLDAMGVYRQPGVQRPPEPAYYRSRWVRTDHGGILSGKVKIGREVVEGDLLGTVIDPLTNQQQEIRSPLRGRVIGMAVDQFVMPGYATFHIGIKAPVQEVIDAPPAPEPDSESAGVEQGFDPS